MRLLSKGWNMVRGQKAAAPLASGDTRTEPKEIAAAPEEPQVEPKQTPQSTWLATLGWISAGAGALGLGLIVGRELRQRYKFQRRTPYDAYSHAGDYKGDLEFGVGI